MKETKKDWELQLESEAKSLSQCADVMPKNLRQHQDSVLNACLDMIYIMKHHTLESLLKEERKKTLEEVREATERAYDKYAEFNEHRSGTVDDYKDFVEEELSKIR